MVTIRKRGLGYKDGGTGSYGFELTEDGAITLGNTSDDIIQVTGTLDTIGANTLRLQSPNSIDTDDLGHFTVCTSGSQTSDVAADTAAEKLYFAGNNATISTCDIAGGTATTLVVLDHDCLSLALDIAAGKIYYTKRNAGIESWICRADMSDGGNEEILYNSTNEPFTVALDISANRMYYAENISNQIYRASMDGTASYLEHLVTTSDTPIGLALDIDAGRMYWVEGGTSDTVMSAPMVGTGSEAATEIYDSYPYSGPWGLALDPPSEKIYVTEAGATTSDRGIYYMNYDGTGFANIISDNGALGIKVVPESGKVYWTDYHDGDIKSFNIPQTKLRVATPHKADLAKLSRNTLKLSGTLEISNAGPTPQTVADAASLYTISGEMFVKDGSGNETQISPHNKDGEWQYYSKNSKTGKVVRIKMEKMIRKLEKLTGESFIEEE